MQDATQEEVEEDISDARRKSEVCCCVAKVFHFLPIHGVHLHWNLFLLDGNSFLEVLSVGCLEVLSADEVNLEQVSCIVNRNLWELVIRQLKVHVLLLKVNDFPIELLNDCLVCLVRTWQHVELDDWLHRIVETYHPPIRYLKCLSKFLVFIFTALQQSRRALGLFLFSFCQSFSTS